MAYIRKGNQPKPDGSPSRWAAKLTAFASNQLVRKRLATSLIVATMCGAERCVLILPRLIEDRIEVLAFYRPKLAKNRLREINTEYDHGMLENLSLSWKRYSHAFVRFRITPTGPYRAVVEDHDGTIRSTTDIDDTELQMIPELETFDSCVGTELAIAHIEWEVACSQLVTRAKGGAHAYVD